MTTIEASTRAALELLQELRELSEHERVEAKRGSEIGRSVMETVCAFANEPDLDGGWLLLGVEEDSSKLFPDFKVDGISNIDKLQNDLQSQCRSVFNVPVTVRMTPEKVEGETLLKVFVPEVDASIKPVYFKKESLPRGAFRRSGSGDVHCTEEDLLVLYSGRNNESYDKSVLSDAELEDIDLETVEEYRRDRQKVNPAAEELSWTDDELLHSLGCLKRVGDQLKPTVAGILLFGSRKALRRLFPMMRVDYIRVPGKEWIPDPEKRFESLDMRGPLMQVARRAQTAILDDFMESSLFPDGEMQRETQRAIPNRVIREAVVNALVHRSYVVHSPIQIIRYSNRLEISNAGYSLKNEEHLGTPGSQPRNPTLAAVLHETNFAENKGSGIRVMREKMREAGLTPPFFESSRSENKFTARFLFHHFLGEDDVRWLAGYKEFNLCDEDAKALIYVREQGAINNAAYRDLNVTDTLAASKHLGRLRDTGLLEKKGKSSATYYLAGPKFQSASTRTFNGESESLSEEASGLSPQLNVLSTELQALYTELAGVISGLSSELQRQLTQQISKSRRSLGQRGDANVTRQAIVDLCALNPWSADELAVFLGRTARYLRKHHLAPMVANGTLQRTHPETPSHPQQAYRAAQTESE